MQCGHKIASYHQNRANTDNLKTDQYHVLSLLWHFTGCCQETGAADNFKFWSLHFSILHTFHLLRTLGFGLNPYKFQGLQAFDWFRLRLLIWKSSRPNIALVFKLLVQSKTLDNKVFFLMQSFSSVETWIWTFLTGELVCIKRFLSVSFPISQHIIEEKQLLYCRQQHKIVSSRFLQHSCEHTRICPLHNSGWLT